MTDSPHHAQIEQIEQVARRIHPDATLLRVWALAGGLSAEMTAFEVVFPGGQTRRLVLRRFAQRRFAQRCPGDSALTVNPQAAAEEYHLLRVVRSAGLTVPAPVDLDESGAIFPTPYLVIEYVEGKPEYAPADPLEVARRMAVELAAVHRIDGARTDLAFLRPRSRGFVERWRARKPSQQPSPDERRVRAALEAVGDLPPSNPPALLHGDFWQGNLLWHDDRLAAVVDWEDAEIGDPLADLAITRLDIALIFGLPAVNAFTERYQAHSPIRFAHLPYWDLFAALRAAPSLGLWAEGFPALGRPDLTESALRRAHERFTAQAFAALPTP